MYTLFYYNVNITLSLQNYHSEIYISPILNSIMQIIKQLLLIAINRYYYGVYY